MKQTGLFRHRLFICALQLETKEWKGNGTKDETSAWTKTAENVKETNNRRRSSEKYVFFFFWRRIFGNSDKNFLHYHSDAKCSSIELIDLRAKTINRILIKPFCFHFFFSFRLFSIFARFLHRVFVVCYSFRQCLAVGMKRESNCTNTRSKGMQRWRRTAQTEVWSCIVDRNIENTKILFLYQFVRFGVYFYSCETNGNNLNKILFFLHRI